MVDKSVYKHGKRMRNFEEVTLKDRHQQIDEWHDLYLVVYFVMSMLSINWAVKSGQPREWTSANGLALSFARDLGHVDVLFSASLNKQYVLLRT